MLKSLVLAGVLAVACAASMKAHAADADRPYSNIDRKVDSGNNTGNSQVDSLNRAQLDQNQPQSPGMVGAPMNSMGGSETMNSRRPMSPETDQPMTGTGSAR